MNLSLTPENMAIFGELLFEYTDMLDQSNVQTSFARLLEVYAIIEVPADQRKTEQHRAGHKEECKSKGVSEPGERQSKTELNMLKNAA